VSDGIVWATLALGVSFLAIVYSFWRDRQQTPAAFRRMSRLIVEMADEQAKLAIRIFELELVVVEQDTHIERLSRRITELGGEPVHRPAGRVVEKIRAERSPVLLLHGTITKLFNNSELDNLAFRLEIIADELAGETREERARALVEYAMRHGRLTELLAVCRELRPSANWPAGI